MKQTYYILKNISRSEATYLMDGEYKTLYPGQSIELSRCPTNKTNNIMMTIYRKEVGDGLILKKKSKQ